MPEDQYLRETSDERTRFHIAVEEQSLARHIEWNRHADTKITFVLAINTAMLGAIAAVLPSIRQLPPVGYLWLLIGAGPLCVSIILCLLATLPQTRGPQRSLLYFGEVAKQDDLGYQAEVRARTPEQYLRDLMLQCHRNAQIAADKYSHLRRSVLWLYAGIPFWLVSIWALS